MLKTGTGTLSANAANTYTGGATVSQGTLQTNTAGGFGTGPVTLGDANSAANPIGLLVTATVTVANNLTVASSGTGSVTIGTSNFNLGAVNTPWTGSITLNRDLIIQAGTRPHVDHWADYRHRQHYHQFPLGVNRVVFDRGTTTPNTFTGNVTIGNDAVLQLGVATAINNNDIPSTASISFGNGNWNSA